MANRAKEVQKNADVTFYVEPAGKHSFRVSYADSDRNNQLRQLCLADGPLANVISKAVHRYFGNSKPSDTYKVVRTA